MLRTSSPSLGCTRALTRDQGWFLGASTVLGAVHRSRAPRPRLPAWASVAWGAWGAASPGLSGFLWDPRALAAQAARGSWAVGRRLRGAVLCVTLFLFASLFGKFASPPAPLQCPAVGLEGVREGRWKRGLNRFDFPIPARQRGLQAPGLWVLKSPWHRLGSWLVAGHLPPYSSPAPAQGLFGAKILKLGAESTQGCLLAPQKWGAAAGFALGPAGGSSPDGDGMRWVGMGKGMGMGKGCHP